MKLADICIRDPFVLKDNNTYYLYGTRSATAWTNADGFDVYRSNDLENWTYVREIFHNDGRFWATKNYWAPECIKYNDSYYLLATFGGEDRKKGIQFLKSDKPDDIFNAVTDFPITPKEWECLDGSFYQDENGTPYLIFSHSVPEESKGAFCAAKLKKDFTGLLEEPKILFYACDSLWAEPVPFAKQEFGIDGKAFFSDGPYIIKTNGKLFLLWSSWCKNGYAMGISESEDGSLFGRWIHRKSPIVNDGGHGMVFEGLKGEFILTYHSPNEHLKEHPVFEVLQEL